MSAYEIFVVTCAFIALLLIRFGVPALVTWAGCCLLRRVTHQS
jgi:hypothetical protein